MGLAERAIVCQFPVFIIYDEGLCKVRVGSIFRHSDRIRMEQNVKQASCRLILVQAAICRQFEEHLWADN